MKFLLILLTAFLSAHATTEQNVDVAAVVVDDNTKENTTSSSSISNGFNTYNNYLRSRHNAVKTTLLQNTSNKTACDIIRAEDLPDECSCRQPGNYGVIVECLKVFNSSYFNDTIGMQINIDPCNPLGSRVSIDVTEKDHGIDYSIIGIRAGESKNFPIPGCSVIVPMIGHLGLDAAVLVYGNPDQLTMKIGLNACAVIREKELCASQIPGLNTILPWYVLSGTYSFGDFCNSTGTATVTNTGADAEMKENGDFESSVTVAIQ